MSDTAERVMRVVSGYVQRWPDEVSEADTRQTLGLGVLDDMSLLARLDMDFEISIPAADFARWTTLGDMVALVDHVRASA